MLNLSLKYRLVIVVAAVSLVGLSAPLGTRMGTEFIPSLDEGDFALSINRIPGISLTQAVEMQNTLKRALLKIPEVKEVFTRIGTAEIATEDYPRLIKNRRGVTRLLEFETVETIFLHGSKLGT